MSSRALVTEEGRKRGEVVMTGCGCDWQGFGASIGAGAGGGCGGEGQSRVPGAVEGGHARATAGDFANGGSGPYGQAKAHIARHYGALLSVLKASLH
jgi:hypothetical protein